MFGIVQSLMCRLLLAIVTHFLAFADNGWWGVALGLQPFMRTFGSLRGVDSDGNSTANLSASEQSAGTSLGQAGMMIGCALATPVNRYFGRRAGVMVMSVIAIIGILVQATAAINGGRYWQLVAGKLINSLSMGLAANVVPTYMSELAPA